MNTAEEFQMLKLYDYELRKKLLKEIDAWYKKGHHFTQTPRRNIKDIRDIIRGFK